MKAFNIKGNGIENLELDEFPMPEIGPNDLLVKTKAFSLNPVDRKVIDTEAVRKFLLNVADGEKVIGGWDLAGEVIKTGASVKKFKEGDHVFGCIHFPGDGKVYAEYDSAPSDEVALIPAGVSFESAAAASMAALAAYQALVTHGNIKKANKVLIHGASGGVGHFAVQIAKSFGAYVIGTTSTENKDFVKSIGADEVIDYKKERFEEVIKDADLVIDAINAQNLLRSLEAVRPGGTIVSLIADFDGAIAEKVKQKNVKAIKMGVYSSGTDMEKIAGLLGRGQLKSAIGNTFGFKDLPLAVAALDQVSHGKVVVKMD